MSSRPRRAGKAAIPSGEVGGLAYTLAPDAGSGDESPPDVPAAPERLPVALDAGGDGATAAREAASPGDGAVIDRAEHLTREVGWMLVVAGVVGIIMPGVLGTPFLLAGAAALWPGNHQRFQRWRDGHAPKLLRGGVKQINRFLADLEHRYPNPPRR